MTKTEANRILGVPGSMPLCQAEQAYQEKRRQLQLKLMPGNPLSVRKKVQDDLALLITAWQTYTKTYCPHKTKKSKPSNNPRNPKPILNLKELWKSVFGELPIGNLLFIAIFLGVLSLLTLIRSCNG